MTEPKTFAAERIKVWSELIMINIPQLNCSYGVHEEESCWHVFQEIPLL